jgi:hypothetical protein
MGKCLTVTEKKKLLDEELNRLQELGKRGFNVTDALNMLKELTAAVADGKQVRAKNIVTKHNRGFEQVSQAEIDLLNRFDVTVNGTPIEVTSGYIDNEGGTNYITSDEVESIFRSIDELNTVDVQLILGYCKKRILLDLEA